MDLMGEKEALLLLGLETKPDENEITGVWEDQLFKVRDYFFRREALPRIVEKKISFLSGIYEAIRLFGLSFPENKIESLPNIPSLLHDQKLEEWLKEYETIRVRLLLQLSRLENFYEIKQILEKLSEACMTYRKIFLDFKVQDFSGSMENTGLPGISSMDVGALISFLKTNDPRADLIINKEKLRLIKLENLF